MSEQREIFWPVWAITWVALTDLVAIISYGYQPFLGVAPWWVRLFANAICVLIVSTYIWRGRRWL